jgi:uncharacterized membrane protein
MDRQVRGYTNRRTVGASPARLGHNDAVTSTTTRFSSEAVSRFLNFSDAVVAIAVTLMVLPLVDIEPPGPDETVWTVLGDNYGQLLAFFLSFTITLIYWRRHHRSLDGLQDIDGLLMFLGLLWLALIVLFQVPAKLIGTDSNQNDGSATLYLGYLALLGFSTLAIANHVRRHPRLLERPAKWTVRQEWWGVLTYVYVALCAVASIWLGQTAMYLLVGLFILGRFEAKDSQRHSPA